MTITYAGPGITRLDIEESANRGYMVRICRNGKRYSAYFSDAKCGGKRNAKRLAKQRYDELCEKHGPANRKSCLNKVTTRNSTGVVGVHVAASTDTRWAGETYKAYCASWVTDDGRRQKIAFSWRRYGKAKAFELACHARKKRSLDRNAIVAAVESKLKKQKPAPKRRKASAK